ncbi:MAG: ribosomal protein [Patescibacteria group bacterium]|nr:ribosomal protein [Patescibacteria group bacterium]
MSRICQLTGKTSQKGRKNTIAWGVKYSQIRHRQVNLRKATLLFNGEPVQLMLSAKALKSVKKGVYKGLQTFAASILEKKAADAASK